MDDLEHFEALYEAFNSRDIDAVLAMMSEEVNWPNAWKGGRLTGREAVRDYWTAQWAEIDPHVEPLSVTERADGSLAVRVSQVRALVRRGSRRGRSGDARLPDPRRTNRPHGCGGARAMTPLVLRHEFQPTGVYLDSATYGLPPKVALQALSAVYCRLGARTI